MKNLQKEVRKEHLIDLLNQTDNLISYVDTNYIYRIANRAYVRKYNKPLDEIISHHVADVLGEEVFATIIKPNLDRALQGEAFQYESWFNFHKAAQAYLIVTYNPCFDEEGRVEGVAVSAVDRTHSKIFEQEKKKHEDMLLEVSKMAQLGEMISFISHQWRRPLNTLSTYLLKIRRFAGENRGVIEAIGQSEAILERLSLNLESINALYSQHEHVESANIKSSVTHVLSLVHGRCRELDIEIQHDENASLNVKCKNDELIHILLVVIENSIDSIANSDKSTKLIKIEISKNEGNIEIEIKDNGCGISPEYLEHIFEAGYSTKALHGLGYGLYFIKKIITQRLGGNIEVYSELNNCAKFRITLPAAL